jgi:hypothetical protein
MKQALVVFIELLKLIADTQALRTELYTRYNWPHRWD